jgi:hypothetical protein
MTVKSNSGVRVLSQKVITRFSAGINFWDASTLRGVLKCQRCGLPLKVGDLVWSSHSNRRRIYHLACYENLFFDSGDE